MARRALVLAAWACSTLALAFAACDSESTVFFEGGAKSGRAGEGGEGASSGGTGTSGTAGDAGEGGSGARGGTRGGGAGTSSGGGAAGGSAAGGSATGGSATGGADGGGGAGGVDTPDPVVCARIGAAASTRLADAVAFTYDRTRHRDCRLVWFETLFLPLDERTEYMNAIVKQTLILWGCNNQATSAFSLVYGKVPLSEAEVSALIEVYLNASRIEAQLSPAEIAPIERELRRLAKPLVDSSLDEFSRSRCSDGGMGAMGGMGGMGAMGGMGGMGGMGDMGGMGGAGGVAEEL